MSDDLIRKIRATTPDQLARELLLVQPMPNNTFEVLYNESKSQAELKAEGYKPVSSLGLMWIKDNDS
jgi:hypothetical protein